MNNTDFISPKHYQDTRLMDLLINKQVPFAEGNIMKYVFRWREKDGIKDLYKARDYLNALITYEELKSKPNNGTGMQENTQAKSTNNSVSLNEYLEFTNGTAIYPEAGSGSNLELYYLSLGLVSEAGEVAGKVKKLIRDGKYDPAGIVKELGDVFWYAVRLVDAVGYSPDDALTINMAKLSQRKENNTISGSGDEL